MRCRVAPAFAFAFALAFGCGGVSVSEPPAEGGVISPGRDASAEASAGDAATPPPDGGDPGSVPCGDQACAVPDNVCCDARELGGALRCVPQSVSSCSGLRRQCNEAADCSPGQVCCIPPNAAVRLAYNAQCLPRGECGGPYWIQLCSGDAECAGARCTVQSCVGASIAACGEIRTERCR